MIDNWRNRYTVREFTDQIPSEQKINEICDIIQYIPAQLGNVDHIWCLLTPEDQELKTWLVDNVYHTVDNGTKEYFIAVETAPYVFVSFKLEHPYGIPLRNNEFSRNNAFHAGCIVSEALRQELNVAQLACVDGYNYNDIIAEYREKLWSRFGDKFEKIWGMYNGEKLYMIKEAIAKPSMAVCVGYGKPLTSYVWTDCRDGRTFTGQKQKKWFNNLVK